MRSKVLTTMIIVNHGCLLLCLGDYLTGRPAAPANAPPKGHGMQLVKTQRTSQLMQSLHAEGELILDDAPRTVAQSKSSLSPTDPITLTIEERLDVIIKRDGGVSNFDVQGTLSLHILNQEDGLIQFQIENQETPGLSFKTHPNINKELFNNNHVIGLKDPNRPFPAGQNDVSLMKWRIQGMDESSLPLTGMILDHPHWSGQLFSLKTQTAVVPWSLLCLQLILLHSFLLPSDLLQQRHSVMQRL